MTKRTTMAVLVLSALAGGSAIADSGIQVSASVGTADLDDRSDGVSIDADSTAYSVTAGWRFSEHFSVDAGYRRFGRFRQTVDLGGTPTSVVLKADGFSFGGTGSLPVGERLSVLARLGAFFWNGTASLNGVISATPDDTNLYVGAGIAYALSERVRIVADGVHYDLDDTSSNVYSIGISYRF